MDSPAQPPVIIRFGSYELDLAACELRESGALRKLPAQPFRVLTLLIERAGQLVTRQEIRRCLWGERKYVDVDDGINFCVNQIRSALRDPAEASQFIKTLPRRGYCFVAPVTRHAVAELAAPPNPPDPATHAVPAESGNSVVRRGKFGGVAAIMSLVLVAIPLGLTPFNSRHEALLARGSIVVADFVNTTGDAVFEDTLTQALLIELRQSPSLDVLPDTRVRETLRLMGLPAGQRVTAEVARELCLRAGSEAVLDGRISAIGGHYLVGINATACGAGNTLASEQGEASRKEDVLMSLSQAASRLRAALGESLPLAQKSDVPAHVTTASLEALQSYTVGLRVASTQGDAPSIPFFKRALEIDPRFALANATLASRYNNLDQPSSALEYAIRAYELRDGVSERERLVIAALYFRLSGELEKHTQTMEIWKSEYPRDARPHASLGADYNYMGQYAKSAAEWEEALRLMPDDVSIYENLAWIYLALNQVDKAQSLLQSGLAHHLDGGGLRRTLYTVAFLRGDRAEMDRQAEWAAGKPGDEDSLLAAQADTEAYFGRIKIARRFLSRAVESASRADLREGAALCQVAAALTEAEYGNRRVAATEVRDALALSSGRNVKLLAALALARAGDATKAEAIAAELASNYSKNTVLMLYRMPSINAAIALSKGNPKRALKILEPATPFELGLPTPAGLAPLYPPYLRGEAYLMLRNGPAAAAEFQKIRDHPGIALNFPLGALAQLQGARAAVLANDVSSAKSAYGDFLALWNDADGDVPVFAAAKAEFARLNLQAANSRSDRHRNSRGAKS
jgi:DNA-binding winged helix-turn-helix (wHTH) protein/tetratricopeptide (TPR) repeat protein